MATKLVVCPECTAPLSPGRFACPSCGALVAAVATVSRPFTSVEAVPPPILAPAIPEAVKTDRAVATAAAVGAPVATRAPRLIAPSRRARPQSRPEKPASSDPVLPPRPPDEGPQTRLPWGSTASQPEPPSSPPPASRPPASPPPVPTWPERPVWPPPRSIDVVGEAVERPADRVPAGAYLPPSAILPSAEVPRIASPARTTAIADSGVRPAPEPTASTSLPIGKSASLESLGVPSEAATRIVVLGAGVAAFGFLLPWADYVIGRGRTGGYLEQWGLAGPGHLIVLILLVALTFLGLVAERLPRWVRLGLPSVALACLLTGLVWPYLIGPFNASIGVYVVAIGAIVMIAGGLLDRTVARHAEPTATV